MAYLSGKWLSKYKVLGICIFDFILLGAFKICAGTYAYVRFRAGDSLPQYSSLTRTLHAGYILRQHLKLIDHLGVLCRTGLEGEITAKADSIQYVFIIGESGGALHSSLYGYDKDTNPLLARRLDAGEMIVYSDMVTISDVTHGVMQTLFNVKQEGLGFGQSPLLPVVFSKEGYHTQLYDNQYFEGHGVTFLSDKELSQIMFDHRNTHPYNYDGEMIDDIQFEPRGGLTIIHLLGQHYTYADRYPHDTFTRFKPSQYQGTPEQRQIKAHYDNASVYVDYVIDKVIKRLEDREAVVIYTSDHGEEVFDVDDYMGHGTAATSGNIEYQMHVPLLIWGSEKFRAKHPEMWKTLQSHTSLPLHNRDLSQTVLGVAGISNEYTDSTRSLASPAFEARMPRIVLFSVDYDKALRERNK